MTKFVKKSSKRVQLQKQKPKQNNCKKYEKNKPHSSGAAKAGENAEAVG